MAQLVLRQQDSEHVNSPWNLYSDGTYVFCTDFNYNLTVYKRQGSALTYLFQQNIPDLETVVFDGTHVFCLLGYSGVSIYSFNELGITLVHSLNENLGYCTDAIKLNNNWHVCVQGYGLRAYELSDNTLTGIAFTNNFGANTQNIATSNGFIYVVGNALVAKAYTFIGGSYSLDASYAVSSGFCDGNVKVINSHIYFGSGSRGVYHLFHDTNTHTISYVGVVDFDYTNKINANATLLAEANDSGLLIRSLPNLSVFVSDETPSVGFYGISIVENWVFVLFYNYDTNEQGVRLYEITPNTYYVETTGSNTYPFDTREKAAVSFYELFLALGNFAISQLSPGDIVYVFGEVFEPNQWGYYPIYGASVIGTDSRTERINLSTGYFEGDPQLGCTLRNVTLYTDEPDAAGNSLLYDPSVIANCRFDGGNYATNAYIMSRTHSMQVLCSTFVNFTEEAIYVNSAFGGSWGDLFFIGNSFANVSGVLFNLHDSSADHFHFYNNAIDGTSTVSINMTNFNVNELIHTNNVSTNGYDYVNNSTPFDPDVTEQVSNPSFLWDVVNPLSINSNSPCFHAGRPNNVLSTDIIGASYYDPPSIGAYETAQEVYSIVYDGNGSTSGTVPVDSNTYNEGDLASILEPDTLAREGYAFYSWNTDTSGLGQAYFPGNYFKVQSNTTLYAIWYVLKIEGFVAKID